MISIILYAEQIALNPGLQPTIPTGIPEL